LREGLHLSICRWAAVDKASRRALRPSWLDPDRMTSWPLIYFGVETAARSCRLTSERLRLESVKREQAAQHRGWL
jgi:hypothetical protein